MDSQKQAQPVIENEKRIVQKLIGQTKSDQIKLNDIGWTSRVYIVNDGQFVVKFPRRAEVKKEYEQEIKIYKLLEQIVTALQTPKLRWTSPNNGYLGYEGIKGIEFDQVAQNTDISTKQQIGRTIGNFLKQLHQLTLENAYVVTVEDEIKQFQAKYAASASVIVSHFTAIEQAELDHFINQSMPTEMRDLGSDPALCHGDLGYWNMILKDDGHIGLIDFGDVGYYDRSKDFCGLEDSAILDTALSIYGDNDLLRQKIAIRKQAISFLDLEYFAKNGDMAKIDKTVEKIKKWLN